MDTLRLGCHRLWSSVRGVVGHLHVRERGDQVVEWAGILLVVALLIAALLVGGADIAGRVQEAVTTYLDEILPGTTGDGGTGEGEEGGAEDGGGEDEGGGGGTGGGGDDFAI